MSCPYARQMSNDGVNINNMPGPFARQISNGGVNISNMPGSFARQISNRSINNSSNQYEDDSDASSIDERPITITAVDGVEDTSTTIKEPLNYTSYLHLNPILTAVRCLSHIDPLDENSPPVHDEHFFIIIHQVFELWFKAFLFEIDSIREIFKNSSNVASQLFFINLRLYRSVGIWNMLIDMLQRLETMTPVEFLAFRDYVTPASGFQSLQFRTIEMKLGLTDPFRRSYKTNYFTKTMFKGQQARELKKAVKEISLLILVERWLEYVYDSTTSFKFSDMFTSAVARFIEHAKEQKIANGVDIDIAEKDAENTKRQFSSMLDPNEYSKLLDSGERRMSHKAMLAAVMISLYHQQPCFQQSYQMLNLLMDVDTLIASWRHKHVLLVQRQIGRKPGTGGTGGFSYLHQTINEKYQVFIDLFNVSSYLIPQQFLPKFFGQLAEPANLLSALHFKLSPQVPIVRSDRRSKPKRQFARTSIAYDQVLFYLLLFMAGSIFAILIARFFS